MTTTTEAKRTVKVIQAEIKAAKSARDGLEGKEKAAMTRSITKLEKELADRRAGKDKTPKLSSEDIITAAKTAKNLAELAKAVGCKATDADFRRRVAHLQEGHRELAGTKDKFDPGADAQNYRRKVVEQVVEAKAPKSKGKSSKKTETEPEVQTETEDAGVASEAAASLEEALDTALQA